MQLFLYLEPLFSFIHTSYDYSLVKEYYNNNIMVLLYVSGDLLVKKYINIYNLGHIINNNIIIL